MKIEISLVLAIVFGLAYVFSRLKIQDLKRNIETLKSEQKSLVDIAEKRLDSNSQIIDMMKEMQSIITSMREDYMESVSFGLDFMKSVINLKEISNFDKIVYIGNVITDECSISKSVFKMFDLTVRTGKMEYFSNEDPEFSKIFEKAKINVEAAREKFKTGMNLAVEIEELLEKANKIQMDISDPKLAKMLVKFSNFAKIGVDISDPKDKKTFDDSLKRLNDISDNISAIGKDEDDFKPYENRERDFDYKGQNVVNAEQTKEGVKNFSEKKDFFAMMGEVLSYCKKEDLENHFKYLKNTMKFGSLLKKDPSPENEKIAIQEMINEIPEITTISLYAVWYKYFAHLSNENKIMNTNAETKNLPLKMLYMAQIKLETLFEDFESKMSPEDEEKVKNIKEVNQKNPKF